VAERYFSETPVAGDRLLLAGAEAHHLIHVMRAKPGSRVVLFDGGGAEFDAEVVRVERSEVHLAVLARREIDRELPFELILGVALPKGDRQRWLVEKAVELGVGRLVPVVTSRSVARPTRQALDRLRRTVIEASKQCGRNRLLVVAEPRSWGDYVGGCVDNAGAAVCRLLAHAGGRPISEATCPDDPTGPVLLAVGPEGGATEEEVVRATTAGWQTVDLGPRVLRVETAAVVLSALVGIGGRS
jgi:16S rRNA (uracil1498-N3)-methyltransferase